MINKNVLITGASSGIGYEMAKVFGSNGYNLILVARRTEPMENLKSEFPDITITVIQKDLSLDNSCQEIFDQLIDTQVDILVNNAGFGDTGEFHTLDKTKHSNMINLNVRALMELTHLFGSTMVERKSGKILNVASIAAFLSGPRMATYFATKAFVLSFSQALSQEWGKYGVQVMTLCPGVTQSEFQKVASQNNTDMVKGVKNIPTSHELAQFGYDKLMNGKTLVIHGFVNNITAFLPRILPRTVVLKIIDNMLK